MGVDDQARAELLSRYSYDRETGLFTSAKTGAPRGHTDPRGYVFITLQRKRRLAHRLAWLYVYGEFPERFIDHINGNRTDNRIANLREATDSQNQFNRGPPVTNKTGFKGVCFDKKSQRFQAGIKVRGRLIYLGQHDRIEVAAAIYAAAAVAYQGEFAKND